MLNALVGAAGLGPTVAALGEGIDLALANKESLVVGGELVMQLAEATGAQLIPVDSEHSALTSSSPASTPGTVDRLVLTAVGRAVPRPHARRARGRSPSSRRSPTRPGTMGGKITIDSATLMNKGLELIEAHHLFGVPYDRIDVVVHPQSIVHSLIHLFDGATLAHLGYPDMRVPISYALHHPERVDVPGAARSTSPRSGALTFEPVDVEAFPCLRLAREAAAAGGTAPCVLNAANEVAVHAFLDGRLGFLGIAEVIERVARAARRPAPSTRSSRSTRPTAQAREAAAELVGRGRDRRELVPRLRRLRRADHPARARALHRGQGRRDARRALRAVLPAAAVQGPPRARPSTGSARSRSAATCGSRG